MPETSVLVSDADDARVSVTWTLPAIGLRDLTSAAAASPQALIAKASVGRPRAAVKEDCATATQGKASV
ncbi:MAG: hypothetical protein ABW193_10010, partial [Luteibacter sp.]